MIKPKQTCAVIQTYLQLYEYCLVGLQQEIIGTRTFVPGEKPLKGITICRFELERLIKQVRNLNVTCNQLEAMKKNKENLDETCAQLISTISPDQIVGQLLESIQFAVNDYSQRIGHMLNEELLKLSNKEYSEYILDEELFNLDTLNLRDAIGLLLAEIPDDALSESVIQELSQADEILKIHGSKLFEPFINSGILQRTRQVRVQPVERWWYYLDSMEDAAQ